MDGMHGKKEGILGRKGGWKEEKKGGNEIKNV
jgi:hypothetical protein